MSSKKQKKTAKAASKKEPVTKTDIKQQQTEKKEIIQEPVSKPQERPTASSRSDTIEEGTNNFFTQTYYLFLALFLIHFLFTVYIFFKVTRLENPSIPRVEAPANTLAATDAKPKAPSIAEAWRGPQDARYVLIEYSDLECPFCKTFHPVLEQTVANTENIAWVFRHYPLSFHPKAQPAAEIVECAAITSNDSAGESNGFYYSGNPNDAKTGFWLMADTIFERMPDIEEASFIELAAELGYNRLSIQDCLDEGRMKQKIQDQVNEANTVGIGSTPTTFIYDTVTGNTEKVEGASTYEEFKQTVDAFITANSQEATSSAN